MQPSDFEYRLPPEFIAQSPAEPRDSSRLMHLDRQTGEVSHHVFTDLPQLLNEDDLLVLNDTKVIPAAFTCRRSTGGRIEGLFLREIEPGRWETLLKGAGRCKPGEILAFDGAEDVTIELGENPGKGKWRIDVSPPHQAVEILNRLGATPLPPYIRRKTEPGDRKKYQTIYAESPGAVAAPTAGLHFTPRVMESLKKRGVEFARVTLHVGPGTFAPVREKNLAQHQMHAEWFELTRPTAERLNHARHNGRRIVAVGTTSVRVLETVAAKKDEFEPSEGWTDLFIYPPAEFRATNALITNFHLPRSTLLMLVAAFCWPGGTGGIETILSAYAAAVENGYRFYSYGDAMLIE